MPLYTKGGDKGETGLIGGQRVPKDHPRVATYGDVDELNAVIGLACAACEDVAWCERMRTVQNRLFTLGAELADPGSGQSTPAIAEGDVTTLERWIDAASEAVEPLKNFVLPGGSEPAARLHVARTVCRRAERHIVTLAGQESIAPLTVVYLNRLSDLLFAWARLANTKAGVADVVWRARSAG